MDDLPLLDGPEIYDPIPDCPVCHGYGYHRENGIHCVCVFIKPEDRGKFVADYITAQHKAHERIFVTRPPLYTYPPWSDNVDPAFLSVLPPPPPPPDPLKNPMVMSHAPDRVIPVWLAYTAFWVFYACVAVAVMIAPRLGPR